MMKVASAIVKVPAPVCVCEIHIQSGGREERELRERRLTKHVEIGSNQPKKSTQGTPLDTDALGNDLAHEKGFKQDGRTNRKDDARPE
jgi:hypothetical protein